MPHFIRKDDNVADNSRDIELNPQLKRKYNKESSRVDVVDLNKYLVEGKPLDQCKENVSGKDIRKAMKEVNKTYKYKNEMNGR